MSKKLLVGILGVLLFGGVAVNAAEWEGLNLFKGSESGAIEGSGVMLMGNVAIDYKSIKLNETDEIYETKLNGVDITVNAGLAYYYKNFMIGPQIGIGYRYLQIADTPSYYGLKPTASGYLIPIGVEARFVIPMMENKKISERPAVILGTKYNISAYVSDWELYVGAKFSWVAVTVGYSPKVSYTFDPSSHLTAGEVKGSGGSAFRIGISGNF
ncbi:hypothetical protein [Helicobacter sp. 11S02596-1]|uniref:hypothetical protein n=1 Tax=Helicobacter sp. 11S02596-1 TaxID=1476194 RepID=UPI000BA4E740|nr:hypothetical protein [Helicobacter sp. 11S02596-1]PAF44469.1 hypothetical protein BJI48_02785 [Helicobacter sp. 11S02596-1]